MRSLSLPVLLLQLAACGEHAYYPAVQMLDTGPQSLGLICGTGPVLADMPLLVVNASDRPRSITRVDGYCVEVDLGIAPAGGSLSTVAPASDALAAYEDWPDGGVRVAVRSAGQGATWNLP